MAVSFSLIRVQRVILDALPAGHPTIVRVARQLGIPVRTLQRKLHATGLSYQEVLDDARFDEACSLLSESQLHLADVATRLGFADPSNFSRAFRRWSGISPREYRRVSRRAQRAKQIIRARKHDGTE